MQLFKMKVKKDGKTYVDYILAWMFKGQVQWHRVNPTFGNSYKGISSRAISVPDMDTLKKYDLGD